MEMKKVTAIVLNYNSFTDCEKCLGYLRKQDYPNLSVIVVDNCSTMEGEQNRLREICKGSELILNSNNSGFSAGNNVGLREAVKRGSDWMLVINPDVELRDEHYVSYVMQQLPNWPQSAVVGTNVLLPSGEKQNPMREVTALEEIFWPLEMIKQKLGIWDGYRVKDETGYCEKVSGCCFFISREFLLKNNYLDENVFMYCEEPILAKCVIKQGFKELYIGELTANHEHYNHTKQGNSASKMKLFLESRIYYIKEYSEYSPIRKAFAVLSRKAQGCLWERRRETMMNTVRK